MSQIVRAAVSILAVGVVAASAARADEAAEMRKLVQSEIKAAMDAKKESDAKDMVLKATWKDGLSFSTADKRFTMKLGGRIHLDSVFTEVDESLEGAPPGGVGEEFQDQTYFRRLRLYVSGDIDKHVDYKVQMEFADPTDTQIKDAWITFKGLKECLGCWVPSIRVGQMFECIGLEHQTSTNHIAFIEKSLTNALSPERSIGLQFLDSFWNERAVGQLGIFSTDGSDDEDGFSIWDEEEGDAGWAVTGRFGLVPWAKDTCRFLHVGVGASYRATDEVRFRARPGLAKGPRLVDTTAISAPDEVWLWSAEAALVWRSFHASAEVVLADVGASGLGDPTFSAWYAQVGWFVTGESKAWNFQAAQWANNKPCCNFLSNGCCCAGALELAARFDTLDLNDGTVRGGEMTNVAFGVNWYLNPNARLMFDAVISNVQDRSSGGIVLGDEDVTSFLMRWDVHF